MSFPRYPRYRDSGVEWLGEVPEHWDVGPLRRFAEMKTGHTPSRQAPEYWENCSIPWFGLADVWQLRDGTRKYLGDTAEKISELGLKNSAAELLPAGTVVLSRTASVGYSGIMPVPMATTQDFWNWVCGERAIPEFVLLLLRAMKPEFQRLTMGSTHKTIYQPDAATLAACIPPVAEQRAIATFADVHSARIDALISEQRRLVELLNEKRRAVNSHAITKGLNTHTRMKPSGIEWLGDVPAHWDVTRVKYVVRSLDQGWSPQCEGFPAEGLDEWGVLKVGCVNGGVFNPSENKRLPPDLAPVPELALAAGDILISRANTRELVGSAAVVREDHPNLMLCDKLYRLRAHATTCHPQFLASYLGTSAVRGQIELQANGASASMVNIGQSTVLEMPIAVPPAQEQVEILRSLDDTTINLRTLTSEAERAITLLHERRTALISAAVTGKIDVRGLTSAGAA